MDCMSCPTTPHRSRSVLYAVVHFTKLEMCMKYFLILETVLAVTVYCQSCDWESSHSDGSHLFFMNMFYHVNIFFIGRCSLCSCISENKIQERFGLVGRDQCVVCLCRSTSTRCCTVCASSTLWSKSAASLDLWAGTSPMNSTRPICVSACGSCRCSSMSMK